MAWCTPALAIADLPASAALTLVCMLRQEELASDLPPRIRAAMQAAAKYRKAKSQPAAAVAASAPSPAGCALHRSAVVVEGPGLLLLQARRLDRAVTGCVCPVAGSVCLPWPVEHGKQHMTARLLRTRPSQTDTPDKGGPLHTQQTSHIADGPSLPWGPSEASTARRPPALAAADAPQLTTISSAAGRWFLADSPPPPTAGSPAQQADVDLSFFAAETPALGFSSPRVDLRGDEAAPAFSGLASEPAALDFEDPVAAEQAQASAGSTGGERGMHRRVLPLPGLAAADSPAREDAEASVAIGSSSASFRPSASPVSSDLASLEQQSPVHPEAAEVLLPRRRALPIPALEASQPAISEAPTEHLFEPAFDLDSEIEHAQAALSMLLAESAPSTDSSASSPTLLSSQRDDRAEDEVAAAVAAAAAEAKQALRKEEARRQRVASRATRAELRLLSGLLQRQKGTDLVAPMPAAAL